MARGDTLEPLLQGNPLNSTDVDLTALWKGVGHVFARAEFASEALTHRSALDRRPELKAAFPNGNERLEFLGDRVLSLAMADLLLRRFPNEREGEIATDIGLGDYLRLGDSERAHGQSVKPNIVADALEALLGAVFLDAGLEAAAASVELMWGDRLSSRAVAPRDPKTALQEWAQARRLPLPAYHEIDREGPPHAPVFVVDVALKGHDPARGQGGSKREAERLAAMALLERLDRA